MLLIEYPPCSTCQKAAKWLGANGFAFERRHIRDNRPTAQELRIWQQQSGLPLKKFFNTSGMAYRELQLKDRLPGMSEQEQYDLLATDGMLVKRPILVTEDRVLVGFREKEWEEALR